MLVEQMFINTATRQRTEVQAIEVVAGSGIKGDKYFNRKDEPGQNITLIEAEEIESFQTESERALDYSVTGRNLICRGVRLNTLVGSEFVVGDVRLRGVELCEPCRSLGRSLASERFTVPAVVKRLLHRAGLRADVLTSGTIHRGAVVKI
jgi:MOSC domain-containing protein YiiM